MKIEKLTNFHNVEELSRVLTRARGSRERFSLEISEQDAANAIYAAMKAEVVFRGGTFKMDEPTRSHILQAARWLINPRSTPSLLLCGLYGNGKTTMARAIGHLIEFVIEHELGYSARKTVRFLTAKEICRMCAASEKFREEYGNYNKLFNEGMIIIDELGEEPAEVMVYGMIHTPLKDLIEKRYDFQRLTIITTNLEVDQIKGKYGERIYDRFSEMVTSIVFTNDSYRPRARR